MVLSPYFRSYARCSFSTLWRQEIHPTQLGVGPKNVDEKQQLWIVEFGINVAFKNDREKW